MWVSPRESKLRLCVDYRFEEELDTSKVYNDLECKLRRESTLVCFFISVLGKTAPVSALSRLIAESCLLVDI